jgi:hypothetical protein
VRARTGGTAVTSDPGARDFSPSVLWSPARTGEKPGKGQIPFRFADGSQVVQGEGHALGQRGSRNSSTDAAAKVTYVLEMAD